MFAYIVRRLLWAVVLLIVLSIVTFSIFYLIPRLGGATPETLAARYVGRAATEETVHLTAERLGLLDPVPVQYWHWIKGVFAGASYDYGSGVERCPAPCLGYSFITKQPVWPELLDRAPVTISLVVGASILWLVAGISIGVISALRRGSVFDRGAMGIALAGVSLPIFFTGLVALAIFSYQLRITAPGGSYVPFSRESGAVGVFAAAALDHPRLPLLSPVRSADPGGDAGDHERGLHPHGAGQRTAQSVRSSSSTGCGGPLLPSSPSSASTLACSSEARC